MVVMEVRKVDGTRYPPASIHSLLCGLQRYMRRTNDSFVNIFDKNDVRFRGLRGTMETVFQSLRQEGIGAEVQHIELMKRRIVCGHLEYLETDPQKVSFEVFFLEW